MKFLFTTLSALMILAVFSLSGSTAADAKQFGVVASQQSARVERPTAFAIDQDLRGGAAPTKKKKAASTAPLIDVQKFLKISSAIATLNGLSLLVLDWETTGSVAAMFSGLAEPAPIIKTIMAGALVGWGLGKYMASKGSMEASREFCRLNLVPMAIVM
ncbi:MAG: hypothetical protein SGILL_007543 [Bacillariaceae sp.]